MSPSRSSSAKAIFTLFADVEAHLPSVVPRTVTVTGDAPRFGADRKFHRPALRTNSQPPDCAGGWLVSIVCALHFVTMRVSVRLFVKSTSYVEYAPNGVHCTDRVFMFGGRSTPSIG